MGFQFSLTAERAVMIVGSMPWLYARTGLDLLLIWWFRVEAFPNGRGQGIFVPVARHLARSLRKKPRPVQPILFSPGSECGCAHANCSSSSKESFAKGSESSCLSNFVQTCILIGESLEGSVLTLRPQSSQPALPWAWPLHPRPISVPGMT